MVFSSIVFLFYFLPLVLALYYAFPKVRDPILLAASLIFYAWGEKLFLVLLLGSIGFNFMVARELDGREGKERRDWLITGVVVNLALLGFMKYSAFIYGLLRPVGQLLHMEMGGFEAPPLPLGISFFTFQAISYLVDVYRRDVKAEQSFVRLAIYISMFPHLVAGPIVRFKTIVRDLHERRLTTVRFNLGIKFLIVGLAQKTLIANTLAQSVDAIFKLPMDTLSASVAWAGIGGYTLQIYYDFAGYSNMAIGLAWMLGIRFPFNFNYPYSARSITDFWRRWHIALSTWFRDYLYIPLGGNRGSRWQTYRNLVVVFFLCGLWHGASFTFVAWGLYHGLFLVLERAGGARILEKSPGLLGRVYTLLVVMGGWVLFRCDTFTQAKGFYIALLGLAPGDTAATVIGPYAAPDVQLAFVLGLLFSFPVLPWLERRAFAWRPTPVRLAVAGVYMAALFGLLVLSTGMLASQAYNPFIYFRF